MRLAIQLLLVAFFFSSCSKKKLTTKPQQKDLTQAVYASGKVLPVNDYKVFSKMPGYVKEIHVKVGDLVKKGQVLITIRNEVADLSELNAKNVAALSARNAADNSSVMQTLEADIRSAKSKFELDSVNFVRYSNLIKENAVSRQSYDQAKLQAEIAKQNYLKAIAAIKSTRDRLKTEAENASIQAEAQSASKGDFEIRAEQDGKVYDIDVKVGEMIAMNKPVLEIGDIQSFEVELSIDETDINLIKPGQEVTYSIDAYKEQYFKGIIKETYPRISSGNKTSKVIATISSDKQFYSGMSAEANIVIEKKKNVVVVPRDYVFDGNKVILKEQGDTLTIQKGVEDLEFIEIVNGLNVSQEIVHP